jgi:mono/diheme cytochrome c family protein
MKFTSCLTWTTGLVALVAAVVPIAARCADRAVPAHADAAQVERGRYLVRVGGCNDCHTPGYALAGGTTPEQQWLLGDRLGFQGPWGTTYPSNLRRVIPALTEQQWVDYARAMQPRPPMPWFNVRAMSDADLRAIYAFVGTLGPAGEPAPAALPPGAAASGPVVRWPG